MGFSPHYLMFGRQLFIPIDLLFLTNTMKTLDEYVTALYRRLRKALSKAKETAFQEACSLQQEGRSHRTTTWGPCPSENGRLLRPEEKIKESVER